MNSSAADRADRLLTAELRRRSAEWVRRYTIEQCALIAERAAAGLTDFGTEMSKGEIQRLAMGTAATIRALRTATAPPNREDSDG